MSDRSSVRPLIQIAGEKAWVRGYEFDYDTEENRIEAVPYKLILDLPLNSIPEDVHILSFPEPADRPKVRRKLKVPRLEETEYAPYPEEMNIYRDWMGMRFFAKIKYWNWYTPLGLWRALTIKSGNGLGLKTDEEGDPEDGYHLSINITESSNQSTPGELLVELLKPVAQAMKPIEEAGNQAVKQSIDAISNNTIPIQPVSEGETGIDVKFSEEGITLQGELYKFQRTPSKRYTMEDAIPYESITGLKIEQIPPKLELWIQPSPYHDWPAPPTSISASQNSIKIEIMEHKRVTINPPPRTNAPSSQETRSRGPI